MQRIVRTGKNQFSLVIDGKTVVTKQSRFLVRREIALRYQTSPCYTRENGQDKRRRK